MSNNSKVTSEMIQKKRKKVNKIRTTLIAAFLLTVAFVIAETGAIISENNDDGVKNSPDMWIENVVVARAAEEETLSLEETEESAEEVAAGEESEDLLEENVADEETVPNKMLTVYDNIELTGTEIFGHNIIVDDIDVSGLTYAEAEALIHNNLNSKLSNEVKLKISKDEYSYTFSDLGVSFPEQEISDILKESIVYGNHGTLLTVYKEKATLDNEGKAFDIEISVDENKVSQVVTELADSYTEQLPQNAEIHRINGEFVLTESVNGVGVNVVDTVKQVIDKLKTWENGNVEVNADVVETYPDITMEELAVIEDLLGSCTTSFADNLNYGRGVNLKNGTSKIDDVVLMPGETLSVYERLTPFTEENGYESATAYANGAYVDSIGGGICQISTTLYNAALEAEIEVVKRSNHSMTVGYVDYAFDAAVNDNGSKDLVIRNNYDYPIYIEAYLYNMRVCVYIYGVETRDPNRVVEYYSEVIEEVFPTEEEYQYIEVVPGDAQYSAENGHLEDELVGPDEILQIQGNYPLCRAKLYKRVTVNGVVVEDTCLHTDKYRSSPAKFLVGANYMYPGKVVESTEASTENGTAASTESSTSAVDSTSPATEPAQPTQPQTEATTVAPSSEPSGE